MASFNELLEMNNSVSVHHKNLQLLAMEIYNIFQSGCNGTKLKLYLIYDEVFEE